MARAGVYDVCLHWPGPGGGWVIVLGLPPLLRAAAAACVSSSLSFPSFSVFCQAIMASQLPPAMPCRSVCWVPTFNIYSYLGAGFSSRLYASVCMNVCKVLGFLFFFYRKYSTVRFSETGRSGLGGSGA